MSSARPSSVSGLPEGPLLAPLVALADVVGCLVALVWLSRGTWKRGVVENPGTGVGAAPTPETAPTDD